MRHGPSILVILGAIVAVPLAADEIILASLPVYESRILSSGSIWVNFTNSGSFGSAPQVSDRGGYDYFMPEPEKDLAELRISWQPSFEFPRSSGNNYINCGCLFFGGIIGTDTLVSTSYGVDLPFAHEFQSYDRAIMRSAQPRSPYYSADAIAPLELLTFFTDTTVWNSVTLDQLDRRRHVPQHLFVTQRCLAWTGGVADRFVIVDVTIENRGTSAIDKSVIGLFLRPEVWNYELPESAGDDLCGYLGSLGGLVQGHRDSAIVAWVADHNGNPSFGEFNKFSPRGAAAMAVLRAPEGARPSFNWWIVRADGSSWGPQRAASHIERYGSAGRPRGDRGLYYMATNGEIDYDQIYSTMDFSSTGWRKPLGHQAQLREDADGGDIRMVLSLASNETFHPRDTLRLTYALVGIDALHDDPDGFARNYDPGDPARFYNALRFEELETACRWAGWVFDTPGIDTDGDGFAGEYHLVNCTGTRCDTVWYKGDGAPDWGGPQPPPSPRVDLSTRPHEVTIRWTGEFSETALDQFTRRRDFEGYRLYTARTNSAPDFALLASWDIPDNFRRYAFDDVSGSWSQISYPLSLMDWRRELSDPDFNPANYSRASLAAAYVDTVADTVRNASGDIVQIRRQVRYSYWAPEGANHGNTVIDNGEPVANRIQRVGLRDTIIGEDTLQYGVYEVTLRDLNAAIPLWFAVTVYDHGDYKRNVSPLEAAPGSNAVHAFPVYSADLIEDSALRVTVYPNPYKIHFRDAAGNLTNYYDQGYEGFGLPRMEERERRIWFANLPDSATIRIWSLDGDLIREIRHPDKHLTRYSSVVGWDLISRNTQAVVSGIYIWRVDTRLGSQIGKLVIIK